MSVGRPSKRTPEITAAIVADIEEGAYPEIAARAAGIHRATFYRWMVEVEFRDAVKKAAAAAENASIRMVRSGSPGWQGSAWYLERTRPERYATDRKLKRESITLAKAKVAEMKTLADLIERASPSDLDAIIAKLQARAVAA